MSYFCISWNFQKYMFWMATCRFILYLWISVSSIYEASLYLSKSLNNSLWCLKYLISLLNLLPPLLKPHPLLPKPAAKLPTHLPQPLIPLTNIKPNSLLHLPQAHHTKMQGSSLALFEVVGAIHAALIVDAVSQAKHMSDLVDHNLTSSEEDEVFWVCWGVHLVSIKIDLVTQKRENPYLCHNIGKAEEPVMFFDIDVSIGNAYDADCSRVLRHVYSEHPTQNVGTIELFNLRNRCIDIILQDPLLQFRNWL